MPKTPLTLEDLKRILSESAGTDSGDIEFDGCVLDIDFYELGYDSKAMLKTGSFIQREYAVEIEGDTIASAQTPRLLLRMVNGTRAA
ncbi:acyl carrier protein [Wenjunlia tyrosinilytica]|uniref:Actinorhodin polyketide synthase n=1 Tax=Wenjunlia tyrosinilytica TaxID=1544741 RepID=A0A917ZMT9_9ACTN|nr:acyl carrier protein [Wenjunlia tyrosinilytica]GGO85213.1 actinorhodin polyketide synthase [Wenjunlia tyrosinilytica]